MKILHVTNMYPTKARPDLGVFIKNQVEGLKKYGIECQVYYLSGETPLRYVQHRKPLQEKIHSMKPDIVHIHFSWSSIPFVFSDKHYPFVMSFCGNDLLLQSNRGWIQYPKNWFSRWLNQEIVPHMSKIIVKSKEMESVARQYPSVQKQQIHILPNGIDMDLFSIENRTEAKKRLDLNPQKKYILNLGNPDHPDNIKRVGLARNAARKAGETSDGIEFLNPYGIPFERVPDYMNAADCYLLTSISEGSPNVIKESLACGTPVVSTDVGDVREHIENLPGCYITSDTPEQIAKHILRSLNNLNPSSRKKLRTSIAHLSRDKTLQKLTSLYSSVLN